MQNVSTSHKKINLRGIPCPLNFVRCRLALESLKIDEILQVDLDCGEPEKMVIFGLTEAGHKVEVIKKESSWLRLMVICGDK